MKKGSGNIVYNDVVAAECNNCMLAVSRLNSKASLLFAGQNDYDDYCYMTVLLLLTLTFTK